MVSAHARLVIATVLFAGLMAVPAGAALGMQGAPGAMHPAASRQAGAFPVGSEPVRAPPILPLPRMSSPPIENLARSDGAFQPGSVAETLDLRNGSLLRGNVQLPGNGAGPDAVVVDGAIGRVFVANAYAGEVTILNATNDTFLGTFPTPEVPVALAINPAQDQVLVLNRPFGNSGTAGFVTFADASTGKVLGSTGFYGIASAMLLDPQNGLVYVAVASNNTVLAISSTNYTIVGSIPAGLYPRALALDASNHTLYVADNVTLGNLTLINTTNESWQGTISVGANPHALLLLAGTSDLYIADFAANKLAVVDDVTNLVVASVPLGASPQALAADPSDGYVYVDNSSTNTVDVVNSHGQFVIDTIPVGNGPSGMFYDPTSNQVFVTETDSDNMTLVSAATQAPDGSVLFGLAPAAMAFDPLSNELAVAIADQNELWLLNGTTEQRIVSIHVGSDPVAVTWDSVNYCFYVANFNSNSVTIVNGSTNQRVVTLPVGNEPIGIAFAPNYDYLYVENAAPTASFTYTITEITGVTNTVVGTLTVGQQGYLEGIAYDPTNGDLYIGAGNNVTVLNPLSKLIVATFNLTYFGDDILFVPSLQEVLVTGFVDDNFGWNYNLTVIDAAANAVSGTIRIANGSDGLDYDSENGVLYVSNAFSDTLGVVNLLTGLEVANLTVAWYPGAVADNGNAGQVFVAGEYNASISIVSIPGLGEYPVNVTEQGLPAGQTWSVTLDGKTTMSTSGSVLLVARVGTTPYEIGNVPGYAARPASGNLTVTDTFQSLTIVFVRLPTTYPVQFEEGGLPSGTNWSVEFNSTTVNSTYGTITFQSVNGTVSFHVPAVAGFVASPTSGTVSVAGVPMVENITFTPTTSGTSSTSAGIGLGAIGGYGAAAAAAAVGAIAGGLVGRRGGRKAFPDSTEPGDAPG